LAEEDREDLYAHFSDPAVTEFLDIDPLPNLEAAAKVISWAKNLRQSRSGVRWAIRNRDGTLVGTAGFNNIIRERASRGEIAFDVARAWWRKGVASEALATLLRLGFGPLCLHRIEAMVTPGNAASCAFLEHQGFLLEGTLVEYAFWKDRYWDQHIYGLIA